ncbi:hypothetical protein BH11PLA1_BH11PLA1_21790 [soil metagenome]
MFFDTFANFIIGVGIVMAYTLLAYFVYVCVTPSSDLGGKSAKCRACKYDLQGLRVCDGVVICPECKTEHREGTSASSLYGPIFRAGRRHHGLYMVITSLLAPAIIEAGVILRYAVQGKSWKWIEVARHRSEDAKLLDWAFDPRPFVLGCVLLFAVTTAIDWRNASRGNLSRIKRLCGCVLIAHFAAGIAAASSDAWWWMDWDRFYPRGFYKGTFNAEFTPLYATVAAVAISLPWTMVARRRRFFRLQTRLFGTTRGQLLPRPVG